MKRFVVYTETGTNTQHYFDTYEEAKKFVVSNRIVGGRVAYLLAYQKVTFTELEGGEKYMSDTFRKEYTPLDDAQKEQMKLIKEEAGALEMLFDGAVPLAERSERSRCMAIARTNLEQAIMWAVKAVTTAKA